MYQANHKEETSFINTYTNDESAADVVYIKEWSEKLRLLLIQVSDGHSLTHLLTHSLTHSLIDRFYFIFTSK